MWTRALAGVSLALIEFLPRSHTPRLACVVVFMFCRIEYIFSLPSILLLFQLSIAPPRKFVLSEDDTIEVGGVGYDPLGDFSLGERRLTPQNHPALTRVLEAACLCNNAVLSDNRSGRDIPSLR